MQRVLSNKSFIFCKIVLIAAVFICLAGCSRIHDGEYTASVSLTGGSGKAYIESPCRVICEGGKVTADIVWSSPNYDFMEIDGERFYPVNEDGNSEFLIPVVIGKDMEVSADTTAMGEPHLIGYLLRFELLDDKEGASLKDVADKDESESGSAAADSDAYTDEDGGDSSRGIGDMSAPQIEGLTFLGTDENEYAVGFRIHRYSDGCVVIAVRDGRKYLLIPQAAGGEGEAAGDEKEEERAFLAEKGSEKTDSKDFAKGGADVRILYTPLDNIYVAASAVVSQFDAIGALGQVSFVATRKEDWYVEKVIKAMEEGRITYGGKYSTPDYESLLSKGVTLAVENTMILHSPKVTDKLEELKIPVFIDWSSYEEKVFGRLEWIRVYGILTGHEDEAKRAFDEQVKLAGNVDARSTGGKTVVVFALNSSHKIVTKNENDYLVRMIGAAGGKYLAPPDNSDTSRSQLTISIEAFYDYARDADVIIYNGTIEDAPENLAALKAMDPTFEKLKAVAGGQVFCIDKSLYQFTHRSGTIIENLSEVLAGDTDKTEFIYRLK